MTDDAGALAPRRFGVLVWNATTGRWESFTSRDDDAQARREGHLARYRWMAPVCVVDYATGQTTWQSPA